LSAKLAELGLSSCAADPCLFVSDTCIWLVYVDDTLLFARSQTVIADVVNGLKRLGMDLEEEDDVAGFLGVLMQKHPGANTTIELLQTGLIQRIIDALQITHLPPKRTPSKLGVLSTDLEGDQPNSTFNYSSVLGMIGYLQANSHPEISFTVSHCARFASSPRRSHEQALERTGQYLKSTSNKGLLLHPTNFKGTFSTDVYIDADFTGGWGYEDPNDRVCVKSRRGFIIEIMDCPILWTTKLQSNIATSTMEAEYTALSMLFALAFLYLR
jgi:hypothetical protein